MNARELLMKMKQSDVVPGGAILVYGDSKVGKTWFVARAAEMPEVNKIYWFDIDNSIDSIFQMGMPESALEKIEIFKIPDTKTTPRAVETLLKILTVPGDHSICWEHGAVGCKKCAPSNATTFNYSKLKANDLFVIESGSQLGHSALNLALLGQPSTYKPSFNDYGEASRPLKDILSALQATTHTVPVVITHTLYVEAKETLDKKLETARIYPEFGSTRVSAQAGKYFGTVINLFLRGTNYVGISSPGASNRSGYPAGCRYGTKIDAVPNASIVDVLRQRKGGSKKS